jgi:multidrug resistance efflux pump
MSRKAATLLAFIGATSLLQAAESPLRPVLLTGEVVALDSQPILVPASNSAPVLLRNYVTEGAAVKQGDLVLRIDANEATNISQNETELEQATARARREWTDLAVKALDAQRELLLAEAAVKKAQIDAALPRSLVPALDYDRNQGELVRTRHDLEVKRQAVVNAKEAVQRRRDDGDLEAKKLLFNVLFLKGLLAAAEVRAERDGVVVHSYNEWRGERSDEGSSAFPGNTVGQVLGNGRMQVRAWALEADRPFIAPRQIVRLSFDALPAVSLLGSIERIASGTQTRTAWGTGRYFQLDIELPAAHGIPLVPGMSVLVEPDGQAAGGGRAASVEPGSLPLQLEGEIASRRATAIAPPQIPEVWQFNLARLAPEGSQVRSGDAIAVFEAPDLKPKLDSKQSLLKEKQRALDKLELDHAEAARAADIDVGEAQSNLEKAARKVSQPSEQIRRIDYDKLIIDNQLSGRLAELAVEQRQARTQARAAERTALELEITQLKAAIKDLSDAIASLTVSAKEPGLVLYRLQFNGEKFAIGNQVWRGISVATLADPEQLMVKATVPEAQAMAVLVGQRARISVPGANVALGARVGALGRTYHIKSRTQPVIVRDVELLFDAPPKGVKPGAAVQIALLPGTAPAPAAVNVLASEP